MRRLIEIVRARKLDRVGAGYAVIGWLAVQVASVVLPTFEAPAWLMQWTIAAAIAGFPFALAIAWLLFGPDADPQKPGRQRNWYAAALVGAILVSIWGSLALYFQHRGDQEPAGAAPPAAAEASIAVLPFDNLGGDPARAYVSEGISDELINSLSRVSNLRVAARTSSFAFRGTKAGIAEIARQLGVRTILEGSVSDDGARVRVNVQLVNGADGYLIWSDSFDRDLTDAVALEDEIAQAVTQALTHRLLPGPAPRAPVNPQAYRSYLQGQYFLFKHDKDSVLRSVPLFERAVKAAPDYADAQAGLGAARMILAFNYGRADTVLPASEATQAALRADPRNLQALLTRSSLAALNWDWTGVADALARANALYPKSSEVLHYRSIHLAYMGLAEKSAEFELRAVDLDPLSFIKWFNVATAYLSAGRYEQAIAASRRALALVPESPQVLEIICESEVATGDLAAAKQLAAQLSSGSIAVPAPACGIQLAMAMGAKRQARRIADAIAAGYDTGSTFASGIADLYAFCGDVPTALAWYDKAYDRRELRLLLKRFDHRLPDALKAAPAWSALWSKPALVAWEARRQAIGARILAGR